MVMKAENSAEEVIEHPDQYVRIWLDSYRVYLDLPDM